MTLYNSHKNFKVWRGERINGLLHPKSIEQKWTNDELSAVGLYKPHMIADHDLPTPEGKVLISREVQVVENVPTWIYTFVDKPAEELPVLLPFQFWSVVRATGNEDALYAWVADLNDPESVNYDPVAWANASAILEYSIEYRRDHPLVEAVRGVLGMTETELDDLWRYAGTL